MESSVNAWNEIFARDGKVFTKPHEAMPGIIQYLKANGASKVLDLGSGNGRHVVHLARNGFLVFGLDNAPEGLEITRRWLADEDVQAELRLQDMREKLPYEDAFFDAVVSVQVIHHADIATIRRIVEEVSRVLKAGGFLFVTVPRSRNPGVRYEQMEPNTFIPLEGTEKGLPHHFFTREELRKVFKGYSVTDIVLDSSDHYCLSAFKR